jgi:uncharacterized membrane protein YadS
MLLAVVLGAFAILWGFWFTYMVRYPHKWSSRVDRHRQLLLSYGINLPLMHRMEKGWLLKALVGLTVVITLLAVAILMRHPTALRDFWHELHQVNPG